MIRYCIRHRYNNSHKNIHNISNRYKYFKGSCSACFYPWCNKCGLRKFICSHAFGMMVVFSSLLFLVEWLEDENYYVETFFLFISFLKKIWVFVFTKFVSLTIFICRWLNTYNFESYRKELLIYICIYSVAKV